MPDSTPLKFDYCFRCDANAHIGYGHLHRCLSLASFVDQDKNIAFLISEPSKYAQERVINAGHSLFKLKKNNILDPKYIVSILLLNIKILIFDMSYFTDKKDQNLLKNYVNKSSKSSSITIIIDGLGLHNTVKTNDWHVDFILFPYVCVPTTTGIGNMLSGSDYVIISKEYIEAKKRKKNFHKVKNILVTFGGSDPSSLTIVAIKALTRITKYDLCVRLIIGDGFNEDLINNINELCSSIKNITLINAPKNLIEHMLWADIAISATGLTKYELSFMQVPSILISIDDEHANVHQEFSSLSMSTHLGVISSGTKVELKNEVIRFIEDHKLLKIMKEKSAISFDGLGAQRIIKQIEKNINV